MDTKIDGGTFKAQRDQSDESALIAITESFLHELHPKRSVDVSLTRRLEQDLGIDSLARIELVLRIERAFGLRLQGDRVGKAETLGDLLLLLREYPAREAFAPREFQAAPSLPPAPAASEARTLIDVLEWHVARHPDRLHLTVLEDARTTIGALTYGELAERARRVAAGLVSRDIAPGDRVALMLPTSPEFFVVFFAILYAGATAVPIYPPMRMAQLEEHLRRQAGILRNAGARILVTTGEGLRIAALLRAQLETLESVESAESLSSGDAKAAPPLPRDETQTALIQYTSGSTGDPKGVVLSHSNLLANVRSMGQQINASSADVFVSWLPLYHDMGLIGAWFGCLHFAAPLFVMSPMSFLVRPDNWLWAVHNFRATLSAAPNFAFELCVNKIDDADLAGLDLSSLRMVANGAEPVSVHTMKRFCEKFGRVGFKREAMAPVYGLAENSVGLAFPPLGRGPVIDRIDRDSLMRRGFAAPAQADAHDAIELAACGQPLPGHDIRIVDEIGREVAERQEGRLEFRGPSATSGYFNNEPKTRELIRNGWLDSGDRAYTANGDIFITGRVKDIIIRAGRHLYPQEIEEAVAAIPGVRKGCVAVFGVPDARSGTERVIVVAETAATDAAARAALEARALEITSDISGTPADEIVLAPPRSVPKTSSGKIRRSAAKELYESGRIGAPRLAVWRQLLRLSFAGLLPQARRLATRMREMLYAVWWWAVVGLGYVLTWLGVMTLPGLSRRWSFVRAMARRLFAALRIPVAMSGLEHIPPGNAMLVFNHSSYADAMLLALALPGEPVFIAKKELARQIFAGPFLRRLGVQFIERFDAAAGLADVDALVAAARRGRNLVFFPEGTFSRRAGLSGFYLGAFKIAAEAGLAVVPGVLRGTRSMLRGEQWFPRWTPLSASIYEPIAPTGTDFAAVVRLRDAVRKVVLQRCGEPDLGELIKPAATRR